MSVIIPLQRDYQIYWGGRPGRDVLILEVGIRARTQFSGVKLVLGGQQLSD